MPLTTLTHRWPPGPKGRLLLGNMIEWRQDPMGFFKSVSDQYGDIVHLRFGPKHAVLLLRPQEIEQVLVTDYQNYNKQSPGWNTLREWLGKGLLTSEGSDWLIKRRIAQPAFHRSRIQMLAAAMIDESQKIVEPWKQKAQRQEVFDVAAEMMELALRIVCRTLLSVNITDEPHAVKESLPILLEETIFAVSRPHVKYLRALPTARNRRYKKALKSLNQIVSDIIRQRRNSQTRQGDLLDLLMDSKDADTGETMNDLQLLDEVKTIFLAGHETTANSLSWTWMLLAQHPHIKNRLQNELDQILQGRWPRLEDLSALRYTSMVIQESLRLYPPIWFISRSAANNVSLGGYHVPKGTLVLASPYLTHRRPDLWNNPADFNPERFADQPNLSHQPGYFPFGLGPRQCIGNNFALMEMQIIVAGLVQLFDFNLPQGISEPQPILTLRPKNGLKVTLTQRLKKSQIQ